VFATGEDLCLLCLRNLRPYSLARLKESLGQPWGTPFWVTWTAGFSYGELDLRHKAEQQEGVVMGNKSTGIC
jgi:hypothetical protein